MLDPFDDFRRIMVERATLSESLTELGGVVLSDRPQRLGFDRRRLGPDVATSGERAGGSGIETPPPADDEDLEARRH